MAKKRTVLVSKYTTHPTRSINMGDKGWASLSAGLEIEIDPPVKLGSKELEKIREEARQEIRKELIEQYKPFKKKK